jgi:glycine/D-amino acid oxidase-like deaminating enzyme
MGRWCPQDGTIDAAGLLQAYLTGQHVMYETRVLGWTRTVAGLCVHTNRGEMTCRLLVNAAGPWAGALGSIPLEPRNRHLFITTQLDWVGSDWPTVWDGRRGLYFRPESGGLLLCACDEAPAPPGDYSEDPHMLGVLHEKVETLQPGLGELSIRRSWVGQRTFAADQRFVIGFDPRNEHVFHVAGLGGHGVTASFGIGDLAADLILSGRNDPSDKFAPGRLIPPVPGGTGNSSSTPDEAASPGIAFA